MTKYKTVHFLNISSNNIYQDSDFPYHCISEATETCLNTCTCGNTQGKKLSFIVSITLKYSIFSLYLIDHMIYLLFRLKQHTRYTTYKSMLNYNKARQESWLIAYSCSLTLNTNIGWRGTAHLTNLWPFIYRTKLCYVLMLFYFIYFIKLIWCNCLTAESSFYCFLILTRKNKFLILDTGS